MKAVAYDSRQGRLRARVFVALKGQKADGRAFAAQALAKGAMAVVAETGAAAGRARRRGSSCRTRASPWRAWPRRSTATRRASCTVVGITGTNGKTTTAYLVSALFEAAGRPLRHARARSSTGPAARTATATRTTPEAVDVQQMLREMVARGCGACAMEVSSHALSQRRVDETRFAAGVFTNLTRDHLDFHGDMESYFAAKRRLFEMLGPDGAAVVNLDDPRGASLVGPRRADADLRRRPAGRHLPVGADLLAPRASRSRRRRRPGRSRSARGWSAGRTCTTCWPRSAPRVACGLPVEAIERGLAALDGVPGRFQVVSGPGDDITVVVDYAHTDDALKNLLETARPLATARLITVFGAGGDRDRTKRPLMGAVAARLSDLVIITSDNPRSEDPAEIIEEIKRGVAMPSERTRPAESREGQPRYTPPKATAHLAIVDRRLAIERAIGLARPDDVVLIAGKGHEKYQVIGDREIPFDDVAVARQALERRRAGRG